MPGPNAHRFDLVVIGVGPGGEKAAAQAAYFGKSVAVVEAAPEPGGAGVHTGTLPSKTLRETAVFLSGHRSRALYGVAVELERGATLQRLMDRKNAIAVSESSRIRANLARHGVTYYAGKARFIAERTVEIQGADPPVRLEGEFVLIATGSRPRRPPDMDFDDDHIHDSDEILLIDRLPKSMTVLGAGVIGCEYACMFAALGVEVTLVDTRNAVLPFLDNEIADRLVVAMRNLGVKIVLGRRWDEVVRHGDAVRTTLDDGVVIESEDLLFAAGRVGNVTDLGLETIGLSADSRGYLPVDGQYRTSVDGVLAIGDVIGFPALASASMEQGRVAVCHAFGFEYKRSLSALIPYGIYTIPEVSALGETEESCRAKAIRYVAGRALYSDNARGKITGDLEGVTKLVVDAGNRRVLGVHVIGERATELVHVGQAVIELEGTVDVFIEMVFNHPTLAESYKYAAYECLGALAKKRD